MRPRSTMIWLAMLATMAACDPAFVFEGTVVDAAGRPVPGARASFCDADRYTVLTDEHGHFRDSAIGWRPDSCVIEITPPGRAPIKLPLMDHCVKRHGAHACLTVKVDLVLPAEAAPQ